LSVFLLGIHISLADAVMSEDWSIIAHCFLLSRARVSPSLLAMLPMRIL
jgi:hypothetical protein